MEKNLAILSDLIHHMKYAKYLPEKNRRETYKETVDRNKEMHVDRYPKLKDGIEEIYKDVYEKNVIQCTPPRRTPGGHCRRSEIT